jgi:hypothetical protein
MVDQRPETRADLTQDWVKSVCKIGQGHACCRYLTMAPDGWDCEKHSDMGRYLDLRVEAETMVARGDNCPGLAK